MAREKGRGNLQQEKSGRWTLRVGINGRRLSRSTGTTDRDKAENILERFLAPLGLGAMRLPLADAWHHYEMSPNRRDIANTTLKSKRVVWMEFARWMEKNHMEIGHLVEDAEQRLSALSLDVLAGRLLALPRYVTCHVMVSPPKISRPARATTDGPFASCSCEIRRACA